VCQESPEEVLGLSMTRLGTLNMNNNSDRNNPLDYIPEIEKWQAEYFRELNGLSKIFISISIALIGLIVSVLIPNISGKTVATSNLWVSCLFLSLTAISGFIELYMFASRFSNMSSLLRNYMMTDIVVQSKGSDEKLEEFLCRSDMDKNKIKKKERTSKILILVQFICLLLSFLFLASFVYRNFIS